MVALDLTEGKPVCRSLSTVEPCEQLPMPGFHPYREHMKKSYSSRVDVGLASIRTENTYFRHLELRYSVPGFHPYREHIRTQVHPCRV